MTPTLSDRTHAWNRVSWVKGGALLSAAGVALTVGYLLSRTPAEAGRPIERNSFLRGSDATSVTTCIAVRGTLVQGLSTSGILRAVRDVEIHARVGGTIDDVMVHNGGSVRWGDALIAIADHEYRMAFDRARSGLLNAQIEYRTLSATLFLAPTDSLVTAQRIATESRLLDSLRDRHRAGALDDVSYERQIREHESAIAYLSANRGDVIAGKSGLTTAREAFETARLDLESTSLTAPLTGFIADCALFPGMHVNAGQTLMRLLDLSTLLVDVEILENEAGRVAVGQGARATVAGFPGMELHGSVLTMNPLVDPKSKTMKLTIALRGGRERSDALRQGIRPGMFATVLIETEVRRHLLLVPRSAILARDERSVIFTVGHGRAQWHYVETGAANDELVEIRTGITTGDTVIVDGHYTLAHDAPVSIMQKPL